MKLPKQWNHWCKSAGLKHHGRRYKKGGQLFNMVGRGHVWRVNCFGMFQRGDSTSEFDRWALCSIAETELPKTRAEFLAAVRLLKEQQP